MEDARFTIPTPALLSRVGTCSTGSFAYVTDGQGSELRGPLAEVGAEASE